jgi:hypothetical protein
MAAVDVQMSPREQAISAEIELHAAGEVLDVLDGMGLTAEEAEGAAMKIQAIQRGKQARREVAEAKAEAEEPEKKMTWVEEQEAKSAAMQANPRPKSPKIDRRAPSARFVPKAPPPVALAAHLKAIHLGSPMAGPFRTAQHAGLTALNDSKQFKTRA